MSNFFYYQVVNYFMFTQKENEFAEKISNWAQLVGINLDRE